MSDDRTDLRGAGEQPVDLSSFDTPPSGVLMETAPEDDGDGGTVADEEAGTVAEGLPARRSAKSRGLRSLVEWALVIAVALLVALGIRTWVFQPFWIPSGSMSDTLSEGDRVLVNKLSYRLHDFHRGDVVVFQKPDSWDLQDDVKDLIKRVIGLPGDTVTIDDDQAVYVNGRRLIEPYVTCPDGTRIVCTEPAGPVVDPDEDGTFEVPEDMLFVMGDNRTGSQDSRYHGFVPEDDVVGRAFVVIWPKGHWRWL